MEKPKLKRGSEIRNLAEDTDTIVRTRLVPWIDEIVEIVETLGGKKIEIGKSLKEEIQNLKDSIGLMDKTFGDVQKKVSECEFAITEIDIGGRITTAMLDFDKSLSAVKAANKAENENIWSNIKKILDSLNNFEKRAENFNKNIEIFNEWQKKINIDTKNLDERFKNIEIEIGGILKTLKNLQEKIDHPLIHVKVGEDGIEEITPLLNSEKEPELPTEEPKEEVETV